MRLNWFSPLPPERTDIAHYTARIAPALMQHFDVVFWTDLRAAAHELPVGADVRIFDPERIDGRMFNSKLFDGLNVYNFGNDARFHAGIFRVARKIPGLAILHDTRLHHFVYELFRNSNPPWAGYVELARELYGRDGEAKAKQIIADEGRTIDEAVEKMPFVEAIADNALAAICHSKTAAADVRLCSDAPILTLPLPFASLAPKPNVQRIWAPPWRFVAFGYINPNRRLESIIHALADLRGTINFQLDVYGTLWDQTLIKSLIARSGLADHIKIHGFAREEKLDEAIASAHLAFNLRHPTMGEASGGILRNWAQATPTLVTNAGWYADLPDDVALKLSVKNELADIRQALARLNEHPDEFEKMGLAGRDWLERKHSPNLYAERLATALTDLPQLMTRYAGRRMLRNVADGSRSKEERRFLLDRAVDIIPTLFTSRLSR